MSDHREVRVLVAGWFSFEQMGASAGDIYVSEVICKWLEHAKIQHDIAYAPPFSGGVNWRTVDPSSYSHVVFACGPFGNGKPIPELLERFPGARWIGVNLSMLQSLDEWNPFKLLLERDSSATARPDLAFLSRRTLVPVVGIVLIGSQRAHGKRDKHNEVTAMVRRFLASRDIAAVDIDTRLDTNLTGQTSAVQIESLIARMDVVITSRLHGLVLSIKNGVPAVAIDAVAGGAKLSRQAESIHWPALLSCDDLTEQGLQYAFDYCLTEEARAMSRKCMQIACENLQRIQPSLITELSKPLATHQ